MDEHSERKKRGSLARAWARRIQAWAEGAFSKPSAPSFAADARRQNLQGIKTGPSVDCQEAVPQNTQKGASRMGNKLVPTQPCAASLESSASPPSPEPVSGAPAVRLSTPPGPPRVSRRVDPPGVLSLEPSPFTRSQVRASRFSLPGPEHPGERPVPPRRPTPAEDPRPTVLGMPAASHPETRDAEASARTWSAPVADEASVRTAPTVRMWTPKSSSPSAPAEPPRRTELLFPWKEEPPAPQRPSRQLPPEDLDTLINCSWPPLAKEAELEQSAIPPRVAEPLEEHQGGGPWPELLEPPPTDSTEALTVLRQWERLSLHEREPRGE